jgi:protein subunit release factor A
MESIIKRMINKMTNQKELLFSLTKKDFRIETLRASTKGGQHANKTETGVRITHIESGAVGESRDERSQYANKKKALERLVQSKQFQIWHKKKTAELMLKKQKQESIDDYVDRLMDEKYLKVEVKDEKGRWTEFI